MPRPVAGNFLGKGPHANVFTKPRAKQQVLETGNYYKTEHLHFDTYKQFKFKFSLDEQKRECFFCYLGIQNTILALIIATLSCI